MTNLWCIHVSRPLTGILAVFVMENVHVFTATIVRHVEHVGLEYIKKNDASNDNICIFCEILL